MQKVNSFTGKEMVNCPLKHSLMVKPITRLTKAFFAVEESRYLLLNEGAYTITIDEPKVVESFCLFFKEGVAEEVFRSLKDTNDHLLSDPFKVTNSIGFFFKKTYHKNNTLSSQLESFRQTLPSLDIDSAGYEEQFHKIMYSILNEHLNTYKEIENLHAI